ncbi:hypothetical protein DXN05_11950 [Deminuibacter soli]|uniref:Glycosyltransferase RgtA/B/C/D-like domain-containing protein n=2 Tax=Deminuibacter soli TaxID=2291815 RepID=A0A3E1NK74_9BACT|nr:hypothetical protein DXN05_11950 [Deminuibacter soli]
MTFRSWLLAGSENKKILLLCTIGTVVWFGIFKIMFPFPNFLPDSFSYIDEAIRNQGINTWPIGYSKFLRLFSSITKWDTGMIFFQYAGLQASITYLLLSLQYLLKINQRLFYGLLVICLLNPLQLHISNLISADALFSALSILWFTQLLWLLQRPTRKLLFWHALVLLTAFTFRYNALWYPFVSIIVLLLIKWPLRNKLMAGAFVLLLPLLFIVNTCYQYKKMAGTAQFSPFGGWQLAGNALYGYAHAQPIPITQVPPQFKELHRLTNLHMDSLRHVQKRPDSTLGIYYLWDPKAPESRYARLLDSKNPAKQGFANWAQLGPLYGSYGQFLIRERPAAFAQYYLLPNLIKYYVPNAEFLHMYNMGNDTIPVTIQKWFAFKTNKIHGFTANRKIPYMDWYGPLLGIINLLFGISIIGTGMLSVFRRHPALYKKIMVLATLVWIGNILFSVIASPVVLRYQMFPGLLAFVFGTLLLGKIIQLAIKPASTPATETADTGIVLGLTGASREKNTEPTPTLTEHVQ